MLVKLGRSAALRFPGVSCNLGAEMWLGFRNTKSRSWNADRTLSCLLAAALWTGSLLLSPYRLALCFVHVVKDQILCFVASESWPYQAT